MLQVIDVGDEQPGQSNLVFALDPAGRTWAFFRHAPDNVEQVPVVGLPEIDESVPPGGLVILEADPLFLGVAWEVLSTCDLTPHEALVIVRGRVDQVADYFFLGPPSLGWALFALGLGETGKN